MAQNDKIKWDKKYKDTPQLLENTQVSEKLKQAILLTKGKKALDIACGAGRNSIFLAKNDFNIDSLDISEIALNNLKNKNFNNIHTKQIDLENYTPKKDTYDLIVKTNYLDRNLIPKLFEALKKDAILFIETYMEHEENEKEPSNKDFLLKKAELKTFFKKDCEILDYDEYFNESYELFRMRKQAILVRKLK